MNPIRDVQSLVVLFLCLRARFTGDSLKTFAARTACGKPRQDTNGVHFFITMEEVGGVVDRALYGGKKGQQGFGNALYEIKEEKRKGCNYKAEIATFYKDYLVIRNAQQQACPVPMRHVAGTWT